MACGAEKRSKLRGMKPKKRFKKLDFWYGKYLNGRNPNPDRHVNAEPPSNVAAHDDEIALGEVLDVHHAPDQRQSVSHQRKDGSNEQTVQQQLHVQHWHLNQQGEVVPHTLHLFGVQ